MSTGGVTGIPPGKEFFISYSPVDERWAIWIAWQLEAAGSRATLQVWDFIPGSNFVDYIDRAVTQSDVLVCVLSSNYTTSRWGRLEWQTAIRDSGPDDEQRNSRLVPIRVGDCELKGVLATITYVDLVGVSDEDQARRLLLERISSALTGRAKPATTPAYPNSENAAAAGVGSSDSPEAPEAATAVAGAPGADQGFGPHGRASRRLPVVPPAYPPLTPVTRSRPDAITVLHLRGPYLGRTALGPADPTAVRNQIWGEVTRLSHAGAPWPDLLVVSGDLARTGGRSEFDAALEFLLGLRTLLKLEPHRLVLVPGRHDVSRAACASYFLNCEAHETDPRRPYWPKWTFYSRMFDELYQGVDGVDFDNGQPWTLFPISDLHVVVAGLNSTIAQSHLDDDDHGFVGEEQAAWFAHRLRPYEQTNWLRLGVVHHALPTVNETSPAAERSANSDRAATLIRDATTVDRLLTPRLNLLLTGTGHGGAAVARPGLAISMPPDRRCGAELLTITSTGLSRWTDAIPGSGTNTGTGTGTNVDADPVAESHPRRWVNVGATFPDDEPAPDEEYPAADDGPFETTDGSDPADDDEPTAGGAAVGVARPRGTDRAPDGRGELLARIAEVCRASHDRVAVRRMAGEVPHLRVTYPEDGFTRQVRIGAQPGAATRADLDAFERFVRSLDPDAAVELVCEQPPPPGLRRDAARHGIRLRSFIEFQGLLDLRDFVSHQTARLKGDSQYPPSLYVPQRFRELVGSSRALRDGLTDEVMSLLGDEDGRFILLLGDFGHGKTFAMREIARRLPEELPHLIPIYIELRALDKAHTVDGLVAAHLANQGYSLGDLRAFRYMLTEGRIALLFDGFDELATRVTYDRATEHLAALIEAAEGRAKIVVASRTHHFRDKAQVLTALGQRVGLLPQRRVLTIENFGQSQIHTYLVNRYHGDTVAAADRMSLIIGIRDLIGLSSNPRMLSFIADLPVARLKTVTQARGALSAAHLYQEILDNWLSLEASRTGGVRGAPIGLGLPQLWRAVTVLALRLWEDGEAFLRLAQVREVAESLEGLAKGPRPAAAPTLSSQQATHAVGAGSLLIRTDEGLFGFVHTSVAEWLVANELASLLQHDQAGTLLARRILSPLSVEFLRDLADAGAVRSWVERVLTDPDADDVSRANALRISGRDRSPTNTDLRGALLAGQDLSYRELRGVDFTGADLTDAQLAGTDLTGATLRDVRLVGARLDHAKLPQADVTGADLTGACLLGTDLREASFERVRWRHAALVGTQLGPSTADGARAGGAAVAPGHPVEMGLAPPAVSVDFGFEIGRIPTAVAYSPDGLAAVVASEDGGALVCDVAGRPLRTLHGHRGRVHSVHYGDRVLATSSVDGTVRLWDPFTGVLRGVLGGHQRWVWPVEPSSDESLFAVGDSSGVLRVWDAARQQVRCVCPGHSERVWTAAFAPDAAGESAGAMLATGDESGTVRLWDTTTGALRRELTGHHGSVFRLVFSPDGALLATSDQAGRVRLWSPRTGELLDTLVGHAVAVYTLDFHPTEPVLASGDIKGVVRLWDVSPDGRRQAVGRQPAAGNADSRHAVPGHADSGRAIAGYVVSQHTGAVYRVAFSPDGALLASGDSDGVLRLTWTSTGTLHRELTGHKSSIWPMAFRPDGRQVLTASNDGTARIWSTDTGACLTTMAGHGRRLTSVRFNATGTRLAICGNDGAVRLWDPRTGRRTGQLVGAPERLISLVFSPEGNRIVASSNAGTVHIWNLARPDLDGQPDDTGVYERELRVDTENVWAQALSPDGDVLATANDDDSVQLWYRTTGRRILTIPDHKGRVRSVAFSPDGAILATGCDDRLVRLWDSKNGDALATLPGHNDRVYTVVFTPDGTTLASASYDGTARLWDVASGTLVHHLTGHSGRLRTAAFSPDGRLLATAGDDPEIRLWDPLTGQRVGTLVGHTRRIASMDFSPDGSLLATCGDDGAARLWRDADLFGDGVAPYLTLTSLDSGWAATAADGRYKMSGDLAGQIWHVVGLRRFELGELDGYLNDVRQLSEEAPF